MIAEVEIDPPSATLVENDSLSLVAIGYDAAHRVIPDLEATWTSSDPAVVSVTALGRITGRASGTATIIATIDGLEGEAIVEVLAGVVTSVSIYGAPTDISPGESAVFTAIATDSNGRTLQGRAIIWASSDSAVATIDATGLLLAVAPGTVTITAESEGQQDQAILRVVGGMSAGRLAMGYTHACMLDDAGAAWCWGNNASGQLGDGTTVSRNLPVPAAPSLAFRALSGSYSHTCGITAADEVYCWGDNGYNQLGTTSISQSTSPVLVSAGPYGLLSGMRQSNCVVDPAGQPFCWGYNSSDFELGTSSGNSAVLLPVNAPTGGPPLELVDIKSGYFHTCSLTVDGSFFCWGYNNAGQLGVGNTGKTSVPLEVLSGQSVEAFGMGETHTCATADGVSYCWGNYGDGRLGILPRPSQAVTLPTPISSGGVAFTAFAAGERHTCALDPAGEAWCWGSNLKGQLGRPGSDSDLPVQVSGGLTFTSIASGYDHVCGETTLGSVWCWGSNSNGQLGSAHSGTSSDVPLEVQW